jgi:hypothetical protein
MILEFVPLLQVQRDLYGPPHGVDRFRSYLATMITPTRVTSRYRSWR